MSEFGEEGRSAALDLPPVHDCGASGESQGVVGLHQLDGFPVHGENLVPQHSRLALGEIIPANPANGEPDHQHFDFRFLFRTSADVVALQAEEVAAAAWRHADAIEGETLRSRVREALS